MALERVVECLTQFQTHNLDVRWVNELFDNDFPDLEELPTTIEDVDWMSILKETSDAIYQFVYESQKAGKLAETKLIDERDEESGNETNISERTEGEFSTLWTLLLEQGVNVKGVLVIVCTLVSTGLKETATVTERHIGMTAASLYLNIVCLPGGNAYRLFQPTIYKKVVDTLRQQNHLLDIILSDQRSNGRPRGGKATASSQVSDKGNKQRHRRRKKTDAEPDSGSVDGEQAAADGLNEDDVEEPEIPTLSPEEACFLMKRLFELCKYLRLFLNRFSLKCCPSSLDLTIERLCGLVEKSPALDGNAVCEYDLVSKCLETLKSICGSLHGKVSDISVIIFKYLFESIVCSSGRLLVSFLCVLIDSVPIEDISVSVCRLIQNLCFRSPEKADFRTKISSIVLVLMNRLPIPDYVGIVKWFTLLLGSSKLGHRVMALEMMILVLGRPALMPSESVTAKQLHYVSKKYIMERIFEACSDKAPMVRSKALSLMAMCITDSEPGVREVVCSMLNPHSALQTPVDTSALEDEDTEDEEPTEVEISVLNWQMLTRLLVKRTVDTNVYVRKAAVQVLHNALGTSKACINHESVQCLKSRCGDIAISVRKQAMQSLSSLLMQFPDLDILYKEWLEGVLSAVLDSESSCQEKSMDMIDEVIFNNLLSCRSTADISASRMVWKLVNLIADSGEENFDHCLHKAIALLSAADRLRPNIVLVLRTHFDTENGNAAWMLLSMVAQHMKKPNLEFVWDYWDAKFETLIESEMPLVWVLQIMGAAAPKLKKERADDYIKALTLVLEEAKCPMFVIPVIVDTIAKFDRNADSGNAILRSACSVVMKSCDDYLNSTILVRNAQLHEQKKDLVAKHFVIMGDFGEFCPKLVPKRIILLLKSALLMNNIGAKNLISSEDIPASQFQDYFSRLEIMRHIPQYAYLSLGKLCLCIDELAKQCIASLSQQLVASKFVSVRRTIVLIMADLCVRYGTLADSYLPKLINCLKDSSVVVRSETMIVLTSLLKEDYLRWRGSLYFCFLITLVDESPEIQKLARYALEHVLRKRQPKFFSMHFIECMFFFNAYQIKKGKGQAQSKMQKDFELFNMTGDHAKRMLLYKFMLGLMTDVERILTSARLCSDILKEVVENRIVFRETNGETCSNSEGLVRDTLAILRCDEMRLNHAKNQDDSGESDMVTETPNEINTPSAMAGGTPSMETAARKDVMSHVKKTIVQIIVPVVLDCKRKFEEQKSPLLKDLMLYLREVTKSYKNEMKDLLAEDKRLAAEIEYDMKRLDQIDSADIYSSGSDVGSQSPRRIPILSVMAAISSDPKPPHTIEVPENVHLPPDAIPRDTQVTNETCRLSRRSHSTDSAKVKSRNTRLSKSMVNGCIDKDVSSKSGKRPRSPNVAKTPKIVVESLGTSLTKNPNISLRSPVIRVERVDEQRNRKMGRCETPLRTSTAIAVHRNAADQTSSVFQNGAVVNGVPTSPIQSPISSREKRKRRLCNVASTPLPTHSAISRHISFANISNMSPIPVSRIDESLEVDDEKSHYVVNLNHEDGKSDESAIPPKRKATAQNLFS